MKSFALHLVGPLLMTALTLVAWKLTPQRETPPVITYDPPSSQEAFEWEPLYAALHNFEIDQTMELHLTPAAPQSPSHLP